MNPSQELNFTRRKRLPVVVAAETAECGLACLAMIASFHGHDIDLNGLRQRFSLSLSGASRGGIMSLADSLGAERSGERDRPRQGPQLRLVSNERCKLQR